MSTKGEVINDAYSQMRISGLTVTPSPELQSLALSRLEAMMAELEINNVCLEYNFTTVPDPSDETGVVLPFFLMMSTNLATRLVDFNKVTPPALTAMASQSLSNATGWSAAQNVKQVQPSRRMPTGAGNNRTFARYNRFSRPIETPPISCDVIKMVVGDIGDYTESFKAYLDVETIASYVISSDTGLTIQSSSNNDPLINYRILAVSNSTNGIWQQVKIVITTSTGRVETRLIDFEITSNTTVGAV